MFDPKELYKTEGYWLEKLQNDIFRALHDFQEEKGMNQSEVAKHLGVSKGYISQIANGNFNFSLSKLISFALSLGLAPNLELKDIEEYVRAEEFVDASYEGSKNKHVKGEGVSFVSRFKNQSFEVRDAFFHNRIVNANVS